MCIRDRSHAAPALQRISETFVFTGQSPVQMLITGDGGMARAIWKGAISFGLVHIPVSLVSATESKGIDFDWLDSRSMEPVGYKRVNKATGKEVDKEHIAKGVQVEKGRYVIISEDEIRAAHPESTQTIDIFGFLDAKDIPLQNIERPYYLSLIHI